MLSIRDLSNKELFQLECNFEDSKTIKASIKNHLLTKKLNFIEDELNEISNNYGLREYVPINDNTIRVVFYDEMYCYSYLVVEL